MIIDMAEQPSMEMSHGIGPFTGVVVSTTTYARMKELVGTWLLCRMCTMNIKVHVVAVTRFNATLLGSMMDTAIP